MILRNRLTAAWLVAVAGVALCAGLAGCSSSSGPQAAEPPPLSSLLATPSPTPTPPSVAVVRSAVLAYVAGVNRAFATGDTSAATEASTPTCPCHEQVSGIASVYAHGLHFVGTHIAVMNVVPVHFAPTTADAKLIFRVPASAVANSAGKRRPLPAHPPAAVTAVVTDLNGKWLVSALDGLPRIKASASGKVALQFGPKRSPQPRATKTSTPSPARRSTSPSAAPTDDSSPTPSPTPSCDLVVFCG